MELEAQNSVWSDLVTVFVKIVANPLTLVLFMVGNFEFLFLMTGSEKSVYEFLSANLNLILKENPAPFVVAIIKSFINMFEFLHKRRRFFFPLHFVSIPLILEERDIVSSSLFSLVFMVLPTLSVLQTYILLLVWLVYNSFSVYHRFTLVLLVIGFFYYDLFSKFSHDSPLFVAIQESINSTMLY